MTTKCIIIDDEPLAIEAIEDLILKLDNFRIIGRFTDPIEAFSAVKNERPELIFLDIEMPELSGLGFIKSLKNPPGVILTTAYREYAVEAFDLDIIDYLLKPVTLERFMRAINRYFDRVNDHSEPTRLYHESEQYLTIYASGKTHKIDLANIVYVESLGDYVIIHLEDGQLITHEKISTIEKKLPDGKFFRIHRSFIVSMSKIKSFTRTMIHVHSKSLPISRKYKDSVFQILGIK